MVRISFLALFLLVNSEIVAAELLKSQVVSVSNGNIVTIEDLGSGATRQVHLYGVAAPEREQNMGRNAHDMLSAMVYDKVVEIKPAGVASTGASPVYMYLNGVSINAAMVKSGYAWVNPATCKSADCSTWSGYQQYASRNKKGLWADPEPEPPWQWRERRSKAEALARRVNEEGQFATYYSGRPARSGKPASTATKTRVITTKKSSAGKSGPAAKSTPPSRG